MSDFKNRYRVDNVPWYWWLPMQMYGWLLGAPVFLYGALVALTSKITYTGYKLDPEKDYIYCFWHQQVFAYNCLQVRLPRLAFFVHPSWYMIPVHVSVWLKGARHLVLGSSGNNGRAAADELVGYLKQGSSTYFNPDGPYGPERVVKKGALHISMQSGLPLVALNIQPSRCIESSGWDRKQMPLLFSPITVHVAEPFIPDSDDLDAAADRLSANMDSTGEASV